jgi:hypothetical protein
MKSDVRGVSQCPPGQESYDFYTYRGRKRCQYDYRTPDGVLFSTDAPSLKEARRRRDAWKVQNEKKN